MLLGFEFNERVLRIRQTDSLEEERAEFPALSLGSKKFALPSNSDIDEGDLLEWTNPAGRAKLYRVVEVNFYNHPDIHPGPGSMNHTEVRVENTPHVPTSQEPKSDDTEGLHAAIVNSSGATFTNGHYTEAIFNAFKAVEARVQALSPVDGSGKRLMGQTFGSSPAKLEISTLSGVNASNEQEGFTQIFMGAMQGIRDVRGHGDSVRDTRREATEYLALASLLMRRLDIAEEKLRSP